MNITLIVTSLPISDFLTTNLFEFSIIIIFKLLVIYIIFLVSYLHCKSIYFVLLLFYC